MLIPPRMSHDLSSAVMQSGLRTHLQAFRSPLIPSAQRHAIRHQPLARHFVSNVFNGCIPYASNALLLLLLLLILPAVLLVSIHRL